MIKKIGVVVLMLFLCSSCATVAGTAGGTLGGATRGGVDGYTKGGAIGAAVGAAAGAVAGAVIGHDSHDSGEGAAVGAVAGGVIGYFLGKYVQAWYGYGVPDKVHGPLTRYQLREISTTLAVADEKLTRIEEKNREIEAILAKVQEKLNNALDKDRLRQMLRKELRAAGILPKEEVIPPEGGLTPEEMDRRRLEEESRLGLREERALQDIHFDFDSSDIRSDAARILGRNAQWLKARPTVKIDIEGHCDERGTTEYNLALGFRRAKSARDYLIALGVPVSQIHETISFGEERPIDPGSNEQAWAKNRRAHFVVREFMPGRRIRPQAGPSSKKMRTPQEKEPPYAFAGKRGESEEAEAGY